MSLLSSLGRLALALVLVVAATGCDSGSSSGDGNVSGTITNSFDRPLQGATVTMDDAAGKQAGCTTTTGPDGSFSCDVPAGTYTVTVTVPGYGTQTFTATVGADGTTTLTAPDLVGQGTINATLVNAVTGLAIAGAQIECRRQLADGTYGPVEFTATASAAGLLTLSGAFTGEAQCTATAGGVTIPLQITITPQTTGTVVATPAPASGTYRVVLTWGELPGDLDSHLTGPTGTGTDRFHLFYGRRATNGDTLDVDDVSSFGPETVTFAPRGVNGVYRYSVHNYSVQSATGGQSLFDSGATVRLFDATGLLRTYVAPAPSAANGGQAANTWRVFEITVNGTSATIAGAAPAGMGYQTAATSGDVTVFLTGGPAPVPPSAKVAL